MKIGDIDLGSQPLFLAPMEDVTDPSFRYMCKRFGADVVTTEFISSDGLIRDAWKSRAKLNIDEAERPVGIQIYGHLIEPMVEAARIAETARPDFIDINFGCPVKKIAARGAGSGMMRDPDLMVEMTRQIVRAVNKPVTVKTRLGWNEESKIIVPLAEQLQDCGIEALTIHGRTRAQMYTGDADWTLIREVKQNPRMHIPIIGNGDLVTGADAVRAFAEFGVDAAMVGRATFGRPWVFKEMHDALHPDAHDVDNVIDSAYPVMSADWKLDVLKEQVLTSVARIDEYRGILHVRRHLAASPLFKGIPNFKQMRIDMLRAETTEDLFRIMEEIRPLLS